MPAGATISLRGLSVVIVKIKFPFKFIPLAFTADVLSLSDQMCWNVFQTRLEIFLSVVDFDPRFVGQKVDFLYEMNKEKLIKPLRNILVQI